MNLLAGVGVFGAQLAMPAIAAGLFPCAAPASAEPWGSAAASIVAPVIGGALIAAQIPWPTLFLTVARAGVCRGPRVFSGGSGEVQRGFLTGTLLPAGVQPAEIK
jgi:hypothetical protein